LPNASRLGQTPNSGAQTTQVPAQNGTSGRQMNTAAGSSGGATAATNDIGTITINQNGVGRMQQTVQGMKVQNVVGQAIVIYGPTGIFRAHVPDSKGDVSSPSGEGGITRSSARSSQGNINGSQGAKNSQAAASGTTATGSGGPVAAGIIRLISDRRPPANGEGAARTPNVNNPAIEQPASAAPAAGQNGVR
ncbi:MAG TPA: hypothetical protein VFW73_12575, partial [Lacipirellulaceae bacterium]|nr:hypothetical protein [Lacipirellulaceae bacterium]